MSEANRAEQGAANRRRGQMASEGFMDRGRLVAEDTGRASGDHPLFTWLDLSTPHKRTLHTPTIHGHRAQKVPHPVRSAKSS